MPLTDERRLEVRHAILAFAAEQDSRSFDWAELDAAALEGLADSTVAGILDELVQEKELVELDANSWRLPSEAERDDEAGGPDPAPDESGAEDGTSLPPDLDGSTAAEADRLPAGDELDDDLPGDDLPAHADDWVRLPTVGDGKAIAIIELDAGIVSALAVIHPAERAVLCAQIEGAVRNVLRETRRLMPSRDAGGSFELVDYAELVVGEGGEPA